MNDLDFILIGISAFLLAALIVFAALYFSLKNKNKKSEVSADKVKIIDGVRYSQDKTVSDKDGYNVTYRQGDVILKFGAEYVARKDGTLKPGTYTVLSGGKEFKFNIRHGGLVREYSHGDKIVIAEGEKISAVSDSVILR